MLGHQQAVKAFRRLGCASRIHGWLAQSAERLTQTVSRSLQNLEQRLFNMDKWLDFYRSHFISDGELYKFIEACEKQFSPNNISKIIMHQTQRLVSLSDDMQKIRPNDEPLQLLFLIMCAENIAKLYDNYAGETKSKFYVKKFFDDFLSGDDKKVLANGFIKNDDMWLCPLSFEKVVEMLYKIRCDVVHEGNYTDFMFYDGKMELLNIDPNVTAHISLKNVREIIIRGCINAAHNRL